MREHGIPYQMVNGLEFFQRKEIKDILAYLHLLGNPRDGVAMARVINTPARGIGKTTIDRLQEYATRHGLSLLEAARRAKQIESIKARPAGLLAQFVALVDRLSAAVGGSVEEILGLVLSETGYQKQLQESEDEEDQQRLANIEELLTVARDFDERRGASADLEAFLEETSLVNDTDAWETDVDRVTLMTLHASKGLEFPVVFLTAVEEGILPHERSREHPAQLEEERRLMFVGITRARQELQISTARIRDFRGQRKMTVPSSFLMELPRGEMEVEFAGAMGRVDSSLDEPDGSGFYADEEATDHVPLLRRSSEEGVPLSSTACKQAVAHVGISLTTGEALANGGDATAPVSPDVFRQGMMVLHVEYGLGQIIALSGSGAGRKATVKFSPPAGCKKFPLAESSLRPLEK
jgi:DNA helicase-2/ATP-dependent DNA helicase PcrA